MTNLFTATPPAGQPPTGTNTRPAAWGFAGRWDWLPIGIFFWGAVFLLGLITTALHGWYLATLPNFPSLYSYQVQIGTAFTIGGLMLPALLLIAGSVLSDRTFWEATGRERQRAIGRLALALGVLAAVTGLAVVFGDRIYHALQPSPATLNDIRTQSGVWGPIWLQSGIESGLVLGVALPFVFRRLSQRTGRAWLAGLLSAALFAGGIFGFYRTFGTVTEWAISAWMQFVQHTQHIISCASGSGAGCFAAQAQTWLLAGILPSVLILLLGAFIGVPLTHPYGVRESPATEATGEEAGLPSQLQQAQGGWGFWRALGIGAGSFAAGLFATGARISVIALLTGATAQLTGVTGAMAQTQPATLTIVQLAPFGILALLAGIRLMRLPREQRPSAWSVCMLALVTGLGLLPTLVPLSKLTLDSVSFAFAASLGALLALCWWPTTASSMRRTLTVALTGWLGFALPILLVAGLASYGLATYHCQGVMCGLGVLLLSQIIEMGVTAIILGLPLVFFGVWMGSWLLERGSLRRARGE